MNLMRKLLMVGLLTTVAACATKAPPPPPAPTPAPPVVVIPPRPLPPGSASLTQILPPRGLDGTFTTANSNLGADRSFWQLKIGLNVAAIGCRGAEEATLVSAYNQIIKNHSRTIQSNEKVVIAELNKELKTKGNASRDRLSTQLFNYFAQPPAQREFCAKANEIAQIVAAMPTKTVVVEAAPHLAALDKPFTDFYTAYAQYQTDVAAWAAQYGATYGAAQGTPASAAYGPVQPAAAPTTGN
jgi:hypothetical protein